MAQTPSLSPASWPANSRERDLDVFEITSRHEPDVVGFIIGWRSRRYNLAQNIVLRDSWLTRIDPRVLVHDIECLVGGTLHHFSQLPLYDATAIVQALMPHFEREIHARMERLEYSTMFREEIRFHAPRGREWFAGLPTDFSYKEDPSAQKKARALLISKLDDSQQKSFLDKGEFSVTAKDGNIYTIKTARSFNVIGSDGTKYCGQLNNIPIEDQMLAQKLLLEHEPEKFFKNANKQIQNNQYFPYANLNLTTGISP